MIADSRDWTDYKIVNSTHFLTENFVYKHLRTGYKKPSQD